VPVSATRRDFISSLRMMESMQTSEQCR